MRSAAHRLKLRRCSDSSLETIRPKHRVVAAIDK